MRAEFEGPWTAYQQQAGAHEGWRTAAVYLRESRREQVEGFSPTAQLKGTLEEALRRSLWVPAEHIFLDLMSGRREDRVEFQNLLALARTGAIAAVLVLHSSRWARNAMVSRKYKEELRRRGVEVIAINAPFDVAKPEGKFAERLMEAVDEFTSDTIGWWVSVGLREKHERGEPLGRLPETFTKDESGAIIPHPELSKIVLEGAQRYAGGRVGFGDLARWARKEGFRTPSGKVLGDEWWRNVLTNPTNAGYVGYHRRKRGHGELRKAAFDGFMPMELFQRVQEVRREHARRPKQGSGYRIYLLSGVARCGSCGGRITAVESHRMRCRHSSQHAECREGSVPATTLEEQLGGWIEWALELPAHLKMRVAALVRARTQAALGADDRTATVRQAMKRLTDAYTWGGITEADYREELSTLQRSLGRLEAKPDEQRTLAAIRLAQDLAGSWRRAKPQRRKQIVELLFDRVTVKGGSIVAVRPKDEIMPLVAVTTTDKDWRSRPDSNRRSRP